VAHWSVSATLFRRKKSEIRHRAKRLLSAFAHEARKQASVSGQRKLIRAQWENGLLLLKEDFVKLPHVHNSVGTRQSVSPDSSHLLPDKRTKSIQIIFSRFSDQTMTPNMVDNPQLSGKEKLRHVLPDVVQMYSLQFKIMDDLLRILKSELQKF
jgi:hypothetical protein